MTPTNPILIAAIVAMIFVIAWLIQRFIEWALNESGAIFGEACTWSQPTSWDDESNCWRTACGDAFQLVDGSPSENKILYCPFCGMPVEAHPYQLKQKE